MIVLVSSSQLLCVIVSLVVMGRTRGGSVASTSFIQIGLVSSGSETECSSVELEQRTTSGEMNSVCHSRVDMAYPFQLLRLRFPDDVRMISISGDELYVNFTISIMGGRIRQSSVGRDVSTDGLCVVEMAEATSDRNNPSSSYNTENETLTGTELGPEFSVCQETTPVDPISSLLESLYWESVILISDMNTESWINGLLLELGVAGITVSHHTLQLRDDDDSIRELLQQAYRERAETEPNFLLICGEYNVRRVLNIVQQIDKTSNETTALFLYTKWITLASSSPMLPLELFVGNIDNVLTLSTNVNNPSMRSLSSRLYPGCMADVLLWTAMYRTGRRRKFTPVGSWSRRTGLKLDADPFPNSNFGFNNRTFVVGTNEKRPFVIKTVVNGSVVYKGLCIDLLHHLARALNFSYTLVKPRDGDWAQQLPNGSWTGFPRDLQSGLMNLTVAPLTVNPEREEVMDFTHHFYYDYNVILVKVLDPSDTNWRVLMDIFSLPVLLIIIASVPLSACVLYTVEAWNPFPFEKYYKPRGWPRFCQCLWYMYGALLSQGGTSQPVSQSGRTVVAFWWIFSIMLTATYSGNLIAVLTVPKSTMPFHKMSEMLRQTEYSWGLVDGSALTVSMKNATYFPVKQVWDGVQRFAGDHDAERHLGRVSSGGYAFLTDKSSGLYHVAKNCELALTKEEFYPMKYSLGMRKGSAYNDIFSKKLMQILEGGLIEKWKKPWWPINNCEDPSASRAKKMNLDDVQSAFYMLAIGVGMALIALSCEHIYTNHQKLSTNKTGGSPSEKPRNNAEDNKVWCKYFLDRFLCLLLRKKIDELSESQTNFASTQTKMDPTKEFEKVKVDKQKSNSKEPGKVKEEKHKSNSWRA